MNFNDIIKSNEILSGLPYLYVFKILAELDEMGLLKEMSNDASGNTDKKID